MIYGDCFRKTQLYEIKKNNIINKKEKDIFFDKNLIQWIEIDYIKISIALK